MAFVMKGKPRLIEFIYEFYLKNFGVVSIAEKKLIILLVSIQKNLNKPRINLFGKFVGLIPSNSLLQEELLFYLKAINFLLTKNCYKDKKKSILKKSNISGQILLKNPRLTSYFANLSLFYSKNKIKTLKKHIESEVIKDKKEKIYNVDLILNRTILFQRQQFRGDPIHFQLFKTFKIKKGNKIDPNLMSLCLKHFLRKQYCPYAKGDDNLKDYLSFSSFIDVLKKIIKKSEKKATSGVQSLDSLSKKSNSTSSQIRGKLRKSRLFVEENMADQIKKAVQKAGDSENEPDFEMIFNTEKLSRAKLNRTGHKLKLYFQDNFYELKNDLIKCYRKINYVSSDIQYSLKFLLVKMARNFDSYTYRNIDEFFISYYLIKKEIH
jgi:hypothetical protein